MFVEQRSENEIYDTKKEKSLWGIFFLLEFGMYNICNMHNVYFISILHANSTNLK